MVPPAAAVGAANASIRLDDAVRGFLTEQGSKKLSKEDLWTMVNASTRLRLTAHTLAGLRPDVTAPGLPPGGACLPLDGSDEYGDTPACVALRSEAGSLAGFYDQVANEVGRSSLSGLPAWSHWSTWAGRLAWSPRSARIRVREPPLIPAPPLIGPAVPRALAAASTATAGGTAPARRIRRQPRHGPRRDRGGSPGSRWRHDRCRRCGARAATGASAPAVGAGTPAPPEPERPDGQRARAAGGRGPPPPLVALASLPRPRRSLRIASPPSR